MCVWAASYVNHESHRLSPSPRNKHPQTNGMLWRLNWMVSLSRNVRYANNVGSGCQGKDTVGLEAAGHKEKDGGAQSYTGGQSGNSQTVAAMCL